MTGAELLQALRLVVILDHAAARDRDLAALAAAAARGGATMLQLRAKQMTPGDMAAAVRSIRATVPSLPLIVNDRLDVALAAGAQGCHLGQDDLPIAAARAMAPAGFVLGGSAGTDGEARRALEAGCDYLGIGPIHGTANKADAGGAIAAGGFAAVRRGAARVPCVAIGGVTARDVAALREAGADGVAVIGAVLGADDAAAATRTLRRELDACYPS